MSAKDVRDRIWQAIVERSLRPGTRLKEEELAEIFHVSRARIRQALSLLEHDGLVTLIPNRGGFVAEPTVSEARDVFYARRVVEVGQIKRLCAMATPADIEILHAHVQSERAARVAGDFSAIVRLSGEFHTLLAERSGSEYLQDVTRDLVSKTSLVTTMYQPRSTHDCGPDQHAGLVDLIARGDASAAAAAMESHLRHVEEGLDLTDTSEPEHNLSSIFAGMGAAPSKG